MAHNPSQTGKDSAQDVALLIVNCLELCRHGLVSYQANLPWPLKQAKCSSVLPWLSAMFILPISHKKQQLCVRMLCVCMCGKDSANVECGNKLKWNCTMLVTWCNLYLPSFKCTVIACSTTGELNLDMTGLGPDQGRISPPSAARCALGWTKLPLHTQLATPM